MRKRILGLMIFGFMIGAAHGQDAKLVDAAKKEGGKVVVYSSMESSISDGIAAGFKKKTGLEMEYWRGSSTKVLDRALNEHRAGKPLFDVAITIADPMFLMQREGVFAKYESPAAADYPKALIDANLGPNYRTLLIGIVYNTNSIKPADAPKSFEDLVKPQFKGKVIMPDPTQHTTTTQWVASLPKLMGKDRADKFIRDLAATKPILAESLLPPVERAVSGEVPIAITLLHYTYVFRQQGAPLDYVRMPKLLGDGNYVGLGNKAPHPNAGKAFIDYFLDDECMNLMSKLGEFVNRKGIVPPLEGVNKIEFVPMDRLDAKTYAEKKKEYQKLFLQ
ncbi:MAG TPA: extracellular solute-binding protein, partial [Candidatus Limnocylindrales bacterium]|nr:extracellular solute-binding protein [Candidatus Limnocylindrales bacterium]